MVGCFPGRTGVESFTMLAVAVLAVTLRLSAWADAHPMETRPRGLQLATSCRVLFAEEPLVLGVSVHDPRGMERISVEGDWWRKVEFSLTKEGTAFPIPTRAAEPKEMVAHITAARVRWTTQPLPLGSYVLTARWEGLESEPFCFLVAIGTESDDLRRTYGWWKVDRYPDERSRAYWYEELVRLEPDSPIPSVNLGDLALETDARAAARRYYDAWEASTRRGEEWRSNTDRLLQLVDMATRAAADPGQLRLQIEYPDGRPKTYVLKSRRGCTVFESLEQSRYP